MIIKNVLVQRIEIRDKKTAIVKTYSANFKNVQ